jgi:hypothetical protein
MASVERLGKLLIYKGISSRPAPSGAGFLSR